MKLSEETMEECHAALDKSVGSIAKGCAPVTGMAVVPPPSGLGALFSYIVPVGGGGSSRASAALTNQIAKFPSGRAAASMDHYLRVLPYVHTKLSDAIHCRCRTWSDYRFGASCCGEGLY